MDDLALVQASAPEAERVRHARHCSWFSAGLDSGDPEIRIAEIGPKQISNSARLPEEQLLRVLEIERRKGVLDSGPSTMRFFEDASDKVSFPS